MFNLNIPPSSLLGVEGAGGLCSTPKTPEIVNSLIAMTNPLDSYQYIATSTASVAVASSPSSIVAVRNFHSTVNPQAISQDSSHSSCSGSPLDSPAGTNITPSVQQTCSQLIKAGLKLSIQSKRKLSTCESSSGSEHTNSKCSRRDEDCDDTSDEDCDMKSVKGLTPEDEDRRRRRRERNKIAATKCRMKKRERTQNLIKESEQLDTQNVELKTQVRTLEKERRQLFEMLQAHAPSCHRGGFNPPTKLLQSPAAKYLLELEMDDSDCAGGDSGAGGAGGGTQLIEQPQRTVIPPMSTIKFSRSNDFKTVAAPPPQQHHQLQHQTNNNQNNQNNINSDFLPNGYCKLSPTPHELDYLASPTDDCPVSVGDSGGVNSSSHNNSHNNSNSHSHNAHHQQQQQQQQQQPHHHQHHHQQQHNHHHHPHHHSHLSDYIPNCDNTLSLSLSLAATTPQHNTTTTMAVDDASCHETTAADLLGCIATTTTSSLITPATVAATAAASSSSPSDAIIVAPVTATDFVKNELVESESPYTTAQSAERFLFESNCEQFVDIKQVAASLNHLHNNSNNNNNSNSHHNHNIIDFHTSSLMISSMTPIGPFHDPISMKNDFLSVHDTDLLCQLTGGDATDGSEFVDLDTGVAAAFSQLTNGGCLA